MSSFTKHVSEDLADNVTSYRHTSLSDWRKLWKSATNDDTSNNDVKLYIMSVTML